MAEDNNKKEKDKKEKSTEIKPADNKSVKKEPEKKEKVKLGDRLKKFFKEYKSEMKKVVWPTKDQVIKNTSVVLVAVVFMATIIGVLDLAFGFGISLLTNIKSLF